MLNSSTDELSMLTWQLLVSIEGQPIGAQGSRYKDVTDCY